MRTRAAPDQLTAFASDHETRDAYVRIRNFLAGRLLGATRDETLVEEIVKCLFCRVLIQREGQSVLDDPLELARFYRSQFARLKAKLPGVFAEDAEILLDPASLAFVDLQLRGIDFADLKSDPIGDAYEVFAGSAVRGAEGQFFTPQTAVRLLVDLVDPQEGERVIDPACGAGGFLSYTAAKLLQQGANASRIAEDLIGIEKDAYLARLARAHVGLVTLMGSSVFCGDSLAWKPANGGEFPPGEDIGTYDVVLTNPPFGARIVAASAEVQAGFELGHKWRLGDDAKWLPSKELASRVPPQVLFVERILELLKPGGRVGMVLPESLVSGKATRHVVQFMREAAHIRAVIGMPEDLFKTSGKGGTHTKVCLVVMEKRGRLKSESKLFMAEAKWCGNDSRGKRIERSDLPEIMRRFRSFGAGDALGPSSLGYQMEPDALRDNVLAPRYYDPEVTTSLARLASTHDLVTVQALVDDGVVQITTGHEVGKLEYGGGFVPFIRTSDISNWEIKRDPKHTVSEKVYQALAAKQDVRSGDILMVRDGTYLIGTCAFVTEYDTQIVFQSHLYKLRVAKPERLSPYLLLALLSSEPVRRQIEAKQFTQDIIDSLGERVRELVLPVPKSAKVREHIIETVKRSIDERVASRELARQACLDVVHVSDDAA